MRPLLSSVSSCLAVLPVVPLVGLLYCYLPLVSLVDPLEGQAYGARLLKQRKGAINGAINKGAKGESVESRYNRRGEEWYGYKRSVKGKERVVSFRPQDAVVSSESPFRPSLPSTAVRRATSLLPPRIWTASPPPPSTARLSLQSGSLLLLNKRNAPGRRTVPVLRPTRTGSHPSSCTHRPSSARSVRARQRVGERLLAS